MSELRWWNSTRISRFMPMLIANSNQCKLLSDDPVVVQRKYDGILTIIEVNRTAAGNAEINICSRQGKKIPIFKRFENWLSGWPSINEIPELSTFGNRFFLIGELALRGEVVDDFSTVSSIVRCLQFDTVRSVNVELKLFDIYVPALEFFHNRPCTYKERYIALQMIGPIFRKCAHLPIKTTILPFGDEMTWKQALLLDLPEGWEGYIAKHINAAYVPGSRTPLWQKLKRRNTMCVTVEGMIEGLGKYVGTMGALICRTAENAEFKVGTGFTDEMRAKWWNLGEKAIGTSILVSYMEQTKVGSLRHPVYKGFANNES